MERIGLKMFLAEHEVKFIEEAPGMFTIDAARPFDRMPTGRDNCLWVNVIDGELTALDVREAVEEETLGEEHLNSFEELLAMLDERAKASL